MYRPSWAIKVRHVDEGNNRRHKNYVRDAHKIVSNHIWLLVSYVKLFLFYLNWLNQLRPLERTYPLGILIHNYLQRKKNK